MVVLLLYTIYITMQHSGLFSYINRACFRYHHAKMRFSIMA